MEFDYPQYEENPDSDADYLEFSVGEQDEFVCDSELEYGMLDISPSDSHLTEKYYHLDQLTSISPDLTRVDRRRQQQQQQQEEQLHRRYQHAPQQLPPVTRETRSAPVVSLPVAQHPHRQQYPADDPGDISDDGTINDEASIELLPLERIVPTNERRVKNRKPISTPTNPAQTPTADESALRRRHFHHGNFTHYRYPSRLHKTPIDAATKNTYFRLPPSLQPRSRYGKEPRAQNDKINKKKSQGIIRSKYPVYPPRARHAETMCEIIRMANTMDLGVQCQPTTTNTSSQNVPLTADFSIQSSPSTREVSVQITDKQFCDKATQSVPETRSRMTETSVRILYFPEVNTQENWTQTSPESPEEEREFSDEVERTRSDRELSGDVDLGNISGYDVVPRQTQPSDRHQSYADSHNQGRLQPLTGPVTRLPTTDEKKAPKTGNSEPNQSQHEVELPYRSRGPNHQRDTKSAGTRGDTLQHGRRDQNNQPHLMTQETDEVFFSPASSLSEHDSLSEHGSVH